MSGSTELDRTGRLSAEQKAIAELAFGLGAKYADRRFDDHEASLGTVGRARRTSA